MPLHPRLFMSCQPNHLQVVCHFRAKLYRFKLDEKAWGDLGTGLLRLMKHTTNGGRRLVLRNDMGKVREVSSAFASALYASYPDFFFDRFVRGPNHIHRDIDYVCCASAVQVLLNAAFYEGMKVTKTKNTVKFIANIAGDGPTSVMIKVTANEIQELHTSMLALVPP